MAKNKASSRENPTQGFENPFFRNHETEFVGEENTVMSPVGSVFSEDYLRKDGSNAMEDRIEEQLSGPSKRQNAYTKKGGSR